MDTQKNDRRRRRKQEKQPPKTNAPEIVYTQPKPFQRRKLMLQLVTVFAIVLAVFLGISVFFKVETVMVSGAQQYSADSVWDASGIQKGDSLLFFGRAGAVARIRKDLPYVKDVRFGINLPGTVMIIIEEIPVVYAIKDEAGSWWLISAEGKVTEQSDSAKASKCTQITGVTLRQPIVGEQAVAAETEPDPDTTVPETVLARDRLQAALIVAKQLEANEILGKVTTVVVEDPYNIEMWYGSRLQVLLGSTDRMDYKVATVDAAIRPLGEQTTGVLDASFTTYPDKVWYDPLES